VPQEYRQSGMLEEYIVLCIEQVTGMPDEYIAENSAALAGFIRSQREVLDQVEVDDILTARVHYSQRDLTLVDWQAAIIIAPKGDFQADIELFKIGKYQLLGYRILDKTIEDTLRNISQEFAEGRRTFQPKRDALRHIIRHRLVLALDFEYIDQSLLLIGDWYTAKLYTFIRDEFYLDHWKTTIQAKLDNLEGIVNTIRDNLSLSWSGILENVQLYGWLILLIAYLIELFYGFFKTQ
jgi:hypothetical protein